MRPIHLKNLRFLSIVLLIVLSVLVVLDAHASDWNPDKVVIDKRDYDVDRSITNTLESKSNSVAISESKSQAEARVEVGDIEMDAGDFTLNEERQAPAVGRGSLFPTANCMGAADAGLSLPGGSLSAGKTYVDEVCRQLEWIKAGYNMGMRDAAIWSWCQMQQAGDNPHCDGEAFQDYKAEIIRLRAENQLLFEDVTELARELADEAKAYCSESSDRSHQACVQK